MSFIIEHHLNIKGWLPFRLLAVKAYTNQKAVPEAMWDSSIKIEAKSRYKSNFQNVSLRR